MSEKESKMIKYPYLSYSKNIIECFLIIGYEEKYLPEIIKDNKISKNQNYSPTIISSIISNEDFGIIDNDFIISQIFPVNPVLLLKNKNNLSQEKSQTKNIIYSFMVDSSNSQDGENKIFYTCFAFIFYESYINHIFENNITIKEEYLIPKAFCIISQYSYFGFFKYICSNLYKLLLKNEENFNNKIPLEIIIYNIVNFTPPPLNHSINYFLFTNILDVPSYNLPQLTGYPYLDFNLLEIFNILSIKLFIEIFLFTILEQSILFFSSNLEILNIVMFIFYSLNYPCNNSTYFWHIVSIPKTDLNEENRFVGQIMTSVLGVHSEYNENIDTSAFGECHLIVDIDNKNIILKTYNNSNDDSDIKKIISLHSYIHDVIKGKEVQSLFLKKYIDRLIRKLEKILKENESESKIKIIDFFEKINIEKNKYIQECFYNFLINILLVIYHNINFELSVGYLKIRSNKKFKLKINNENIIIQNEEKYFCKLFKSSSKYKLYFENFIGKRECNELYKIPLLLSEEFIILKINYNQNKIPLKLSYLQLMDDVYISSKEPKIVQLKHFYYLFIEDEIRLEIIDTTKKCQLTIDQSNKSLFSFNKYILQNFIYILKNHFSQEKLKVYFPSITIKQEEISTFNLKDLLDKFQLFFEENNYIDSLNYLIYSSFYIFSVLIPLFNNEILLFYIDKLLTCSKKINFFLRYYINIILQSFYQYYLINNDTNKYPNMIYDNISIYFYLLFMALKEQQILPNEEMLVTQKVFESKNINKKYNFVVKTSKDLENDINSNNKNELINKDNNNFKIYMKYNFDRNKFYKYNNIIKLSMKELKECNISLNKENNNTHENKDIKIIVKIKDKIYSENLFSPKKIFKIIKKEYEDFTRHFSLGQVNIKVIKGILINLIQYSIELNELSILQELFINGLYLSDLFIQNNKVLNK